jgi:hypothetical protein
LCLGLGAKCPQNSVAWPPRRFPAGRGAKTATRQAGRGPYLGYQAEPWSGRPGESLPRGSHGSGRADFPHPALRLTASLRDRGGTDARLRKRIPLEQSVHFLPRYPCPLRAATQPLLPHDDDALSELAERPQVADDGEVPEMPQQLPRECCPLFANRFMAVTPTPIRDALEGAPDRSAAVFCFTTQYPLRDIAQ